MVLGKRRADTESYEAGEERLPHCLSAAGYAVGVERVFCDCMGGLMKCGWLALEVLDALEYLVAFLKKKKDSSD